MWLLSSPTTKGNGMTETMGTTSGGTPPTGTDTSTRDVAKEEAKGVAQDAAQKGKHTAETAKEQAGQVADEAMSQARMLFEQTRDQVTAQGSAQQERAASGLRSLADELTAMTSGGTQQEGLATDLARQASERVRTAADFIENRQPGELLDEVRGFARRRPGTFLLGAVALGFLGGRLTRGITEEVRDDSGTSGTSSTPLATRTAPTAGLPANSPTNATGVAGGVQSETGYSSVQPVDSGVSEAAPASPGYSVTPEEQATTQFTPTSDGGPI